MCIRDSFHFFVKALEGAYIVLSEQPKVYLERLNHAEIDGIKYRAFELGACTRCHGLYLVGSIETCLLYTSRFALK